MRSGKSSYHRIERGLLLVLVWLRPGQQQLEQERGRLVWQEQVEA